MRARHLAVGFATALVSAAVAATASATPFRPATTGLAFTPLQTPTCFNADLCYSPQMLRQAYDFPNGRGAPTGAGQTVIVVDAFGSPTLSSDLAQFEQQFGLGPANLTVFPQQIPQSNASSGDTVSWALETSLDVEYVQAMAPGAHIVLAVADTDDSINLYEVEREALQQYPGAILSQSFGGDETGLFSDPDAEQAFDGLYAQLALHGGTAVAASGDFGATGTTLLGALGAFGDPIGVPTPMAAYPASSELVLAVGGTMGNPYPGGLLDRNGRYGGEQVWNEAVPTSPVGWGTSGGATSVVYPRPLWQIPFTQSTGRSEPDVAYNAAAQGGATIVFRGKLGSLAGTSAAAPQWAAIVALANEARAQRHRGPVGLVTPLLYLLASDRSTYRQDFHDVTVGTNTMFGADAPFPGFSAGPGFDIPTGLGTPDVARLVDDLSGHVARTLRMGDFLGFHGHGGKHGQFAPGR